MIIGIKFPDNDYHNTMLHVMKNLMTAIQWNDELEETLLSKDKVAEIFNLVAYPLYVLYQKGCIADPTRSEYIKITTDNVYIGQEAIDHIIACNHWDNHEFYILDTEANHVLWY